jgi:hypothetical protein
LAERSDSVAVAANSVATLGKLDLKPLLDREALVLVKLTLTDSQGTTLSDNLYWQGRDGASHRRLVDLAAQPIGVSVLAHKVDEGTRVDVLLTNQGQAPALEAKITMLDEKGVRVLPAYYDDNYVSLLPGESRHIQVLCPSGSARCAKLALRGWNAEAREIAVQAPAP